jgi:thiol-disulfide isomerase/thioredoxin
MIQGLKSGKHYKLITRAKSGDKTLEVVTLTQAPNVHLLIHVNERFAVPATPEKSKADKGKKSAKSGKEQPASAQIPIPPMPGWPQQGPVPIQPSPGYFGDKTRIAQGHTDIAINPPAVHVPGTWKLPGPESKGPTLPPGPSPYNIVPGPAHVPSSMKYGMRLENFALYDLELQPWELKTKRRGSVVLLDFWKTNCPPCLQTIHNLRALQQKFGQEGLEVVGIAYEDGNKDYWQQATKVKAVAAQWNANYQMLLGSGPKCPLKRDLMVTNYPTLVLLDEQGQIIWQHVGLMDAVALDNLEFRIRQKLFTPRF